MSTVPPNLDRSISDMTNASQNSSEQSKQQQQQSVVLPVYNKYFEYLISGDMSDITIYAPFPPGMVDIDTLEQKKDNNHNNNNQNDDVNSTQTNDPLNVLQYSTPSDIKKAIDDRNGTKQLKIQKDNDDDDEFNLFAQQSSTTTTKTQSTSSSLSSSLSKQPQQQQQHPIPGIKYMTFNLHRFIVAARSPILAILLQRSPTIYISLRCDVFQALVWFMYTDNNDHVPPHLYPYIVWAGDYFAIKPAQIWSLQMTMRLVSIDNIVILANGILNTYYDVVYDHNNNNSNTNDNNKITMGGKNIIIKSLNNNNDNNNDKNGQNDNKIVPFLSLQNCPKPIIYIIDFLMLHFQQVQPEKMQEYIDSINIQQLHPQLQAMIIESDQKIAQLCNFEYEFEQID